MGMETELNHLDQKSLKDSWVLTNENFDADVLLQTIFMKGATFEPIFSSPMYYYNMVSFWWSRWKRNFEKWFDALDIEYNPLENYDRQELWHDDIYDAGTMDASDNVTEVIDDDATNGNTSTDSVSAYDSSTYSPKEQTVDSGSSSDDRTTTTDSTLDHDMTNDRDVDHTGRIHGNIGVTTSQQMLQSELDLQKWNVYNHMADIFLNEMTVQVY